MKNLINKLTEIVDNALLYLDAHLMDWLHWLGKTILTTLAFFAAVCLVTVACPPLLLEICCFFIALVLGLWGICQIVDMITCLVAALVAFVAARF